MRKTLILGTLAAFCSHSSFAASNNEEQSKLDISGKVMLDAYQYDGLHSENVREQDVVLRRARLKLDYRFDSPWRAKIQFSYDEKDNKFEIKDWQLGYKFNNGMLLKTGEFKEPFGLEYVSSSTHMPFVERSMATDAFAPKRNLGVQLGQNLSRFSWHVGLFNNNEDSDFEHLAYTGRVTANFKQKQFLKGRWHIGFGASARDINPQNPIRINESIELYSGDSIVESNRIDASSERLSNVELAFNSGKWQFQTEWFWQSVEALPESNDQDSDYSGQYYQASYLLIGDSISYDKNRFGKIKTDSDYGALQLVARFSELNARDNEVGSTAENVTVGLNYYYQDYKVMLHYSDASLEGKNAALGDAGDSVALRLQYKF